MTFKLGVIAEDDSDFEVIKILLRRSYPSLQSASFKRRVTRGCGPIPKKCSSYAKLLENEGCNAIILVRDKDKENIVNLRTALESILQGVTLVKNCVVIPVEEIEAWLISDEKAISKVFGIRKVKALKNPEQLNNPKEWLASLVFKESKSKRKYINTIHNIQLAKHLDFKKIRGCSSFNVLEVFIKSVLKSTKGDAHN